MSAKTNKVCDIDINNDFFQEYDYEEGPVIGSGSFATVVLASSKCDPSNQMAVKIFEFIGLDTESDSNYDQQKMFLTEVRLMKRLDHKHIMPITVSIKTPGYWAIAMPYCSRGTVSDFIKNLSQDQQFNYIEQICQGVDYLHKIKIIHGDLKPRNILIKDDDTLCISDFGLAKAVPTFTIEIFMNYGTKGYRAPETWKDKRVNPFKVDLFALGVTFRMILLKNKPLLYNTYMEEMENSKDVPTQYRYLVTCLVHEDPQLRPSACDILNVLE